MRKGKRPTGMAWHIEYGNGNYERVHRNWCGHYDQNTGRCKLLGESCYSDTACSHYWALKKPSPNFKPVSVSKPFVGVKKLPIDEIIVNEKKGKPSQGAISGILKFYNEHHNVFEHPISVICENNKYILKEFYKIYYVAKKIGLKSIDAQMYSGVPYAKIKKYKQIGKIINHKALGRGTIVGVDDNKISVRFVSGKLVTLNIILCVKQKQFR